MKKAIAIFMMIAITCINASSGFGTHDFMPLEGDMYCKKTPPKLNCCAGTWQDPETEMIHRGGMWRTGENADECQEEMYNSFLAEMEALK